MVTQRYHFPFHYKYHCWGHLQTELKKLKIVLHLTGAAFSEYISAQRLCAFIALYMSAKRSDWWPVQLWLICSVCEMINCGFCLSVFLLCHVELFTPSAALQDSHSYCFGGGSQSQSKLFTCTVNPQFLMIMWNVINVLWKVELYVVVWNSLICKWGNSVWSKR